MREHLDPDTPSVHQNGDRSVAARTRARQARALQRAAERATDTGGAAGGGECARFAQPVPPERFALYVDSEETEELFDEELLVSAAFEPARILAWGLEDAQGACAHRSDSGSGHREQFVCDSAERMCELLELAGHGPLRVLYL